MRGKEAEGAVLRCLREGMVLALLTEGVGYGIWVWIDYLLVTCLRECLD